MNINLPLILSRGDLREILSHPVSPVSREKAFRAIIESLGRRRVITVGDVVTFEYIRIKNAPPLIGFIDGFTKRDIETETSLEEEFEDHIEISNQRGEVDLELIEDAMSQISINFQQGVSTLVFVKGEEDLLSLATPLFFSSPDSVLIYGQPNMGAVVLQLYYPMREYLTSLLSFLSPSIGREISV